MLNVLKYYPFGFKYYIRHPFEFISQFFSNLQMAKQRAKYGYCTRDIGDINYFILNLISAVLRGYVNTFYPYEEGEWKNLEILADEFAKICDEKYDDYKMYTVRQKRLRQIFDELTEQLAYLWY